MSLIKVIKKYFKDKKIRKSILKELKDNNSNMEVYELSEGDSLFTIMGISGERAKELSALINVSYAPGQNIIKTITTISKECKNRQELALCMFIVGSATEQIKNPLFWEKYYE